LVLTIQDCGSSTAVDAVILNFMEKCVTRVEQNIYFFPGHLS